MVVFFAVAVHTSDGFVRGLLGPLLFFFRLLLLFVELRLSLLPVILGEVATLADACRVVRLVSMRALGRFLLLTVEVVALSAHALGVLLLVRVLALAGVQLPQLFLSLSQPFNFPLQFELLGIKLSNFTSESLNFELELGILSFLAEDVEEAVQRLFNLLEDGLAQVLLVDCVMLDPPILDAGLVGSRLLAQAERQVFLQGRMEHLISRVAKLVAAYNRCIVWTLGLHLAVLTVR